MTVEVGQIVTVGGVMSAARPARHRKRGGKEQQDKF